MAAKVALTAEEFRENSQRSIALFNTEKLSTNSTHVLKSAYCNSVHFCRCNLHGACGGKALDMAEDIEELSLQSARSVWRQRIRFQQIANLTGCNLHGACGGKVSKYDAHPESACCNLHGACGGKDCVKPVSDTLYRCNLHGACGGKDADISLHFSFPRCNLHGACGGKVVLLGAYNTFYTLQSARGVWKTLHHPPEKNPRKFMQTYCIFIHLAV